MSLCLGALGRFIIKIFWALRSVGSFIEYHVISYRMITNFCHIWRNLYVFQHICVRCLALLLIHCTYLRFIFAQFQSNSDRLICWASAARLHYWCLFNFSCSIYCHLFLLRYHKTALSFLLWSIFILISYLLFFCQSWWLLLITQLLFSLLLLLWFIIWHGPGVDALLPWIN